MNNKLFNYYNKLSLFKKLTIPNIIILFLGLLYINIIINQTNKILINNSNLENTLFPMVEISLSNNNLLRQISESFTFAVLSSEKDLLKNINTNAQQISKNINKLISYNALNITATLSEEFDSYLQTNYHLSNLLINNKKLIFENSPEIQKSLLQYRVLKNKFKRIEQDIKVLIKQNNIDTNKKIKKLIKNSIILAILLYLLIVLISYFIYNDFKNKFQFLINSLTNFEYHNTSFPSIAKDEFGILSDKLNTIFKTYEKNYNKLDIEKIHMEEIAKKDKLTQLYNRHYIDELLTDIKEKRQAYSIVIMDIDDFKLVNDTYGHLVGDEVLIKLSNILSSKLRKYDVLARWGGEEFILLIPGNSKDKLLILCEKLRKSIYLENFDKVGNITISLGCTIFDNFNIKIKNTLKVADDALYEAKRTGKNKVVFK